MFELRKADEYTLKYMEAYSHMFPMSDPGQVTAKIRAGLINPEIQDAVRAGLIASDTSGTGTVSNEKLKVRLQLKLSIVNKVFFSNTTYRTPAECRSWANFILF